MLANESCCFWSQEVPDRRIVHWIILYNHFHYMLNLGFRDERCVCVDEERPYAFYPCVNFESTYTAIIYRHAIPTHKSVVTSVHIIERSCRRVKPDTRN